MSLLKVEDLSVNYGVIQAVKGVNFEVNEGEIVSLIGANGAASFAKVTQIITSPPKSGTGT